MAPRDGLLVRRRIDAGNGDRRGVGRSVAGPIRHGHPTGAPTRLHGALDQHGVLAVDLLELDPDDLLARRRHVLADVVRPDRQLAMAAIDEDGEADRLRPAEVDEGVHRRPDRAAGVEDVVDEDDRRPVQVERQVRALHDRLLGDERQVVAVEGDVERPDRDRGRLVLGDRGGDPAGERHAAALDAHEDQSGRPRLLLHDLVGDADRGPADLVRGHDLTAAHRSFPGLAGHSSGLSGPSKGLVRSIPGGCRSPAAGGRSRVSRRRPSPRSCRTTTGSRRRRRSPACTGR